MSKPFANTDAFAEKEATEALLRQAGSKDVEQAMAAHQQVAAAIDIPLREVLLNGAVAEGIFYSDELPIGTSPEYPIDIIKPGDETQFLAYHVPSNGDLPERLAFGDFFQIRTFEVGNTQHWPLRILKTARFNIMKRYMELYEQGWIQKNNDDAFAVLLKAAKDRNLIVFDPVAGQGQFTIKLLTNLQQKMKRAGGGNSATPNRFKLTDLYMSPEGLAGMRSMTVAELPETIRNQIAATAKGYIDTLWGVTFHELEEFGPDGKYQKYYTDTLGGALIDDQVAGHTAHDDVELVLGLDLTNRESVFINPVVSPVVTYPEGEAYFRKGMGGVWGKGEWGWGVLDNRNLILGSF